MRLSQLPASLPLGSRADLEALDANVAWLREEAENVRPSEQRAALRHELGVLEQRAGREAACVREFLAAVNAASGFREPLERLIAIVERRHSFKNLPKLLEHLCKTATDRGEVARAQLAYAWLCISHAHHPARARSAALAALEAVPSDPGALLTLEYLERRTGDGSGLRGVATQQLAAARDPAWASVLSLELADLHAAAGAYGRARALLDPVVCRGGLAAFQALERGAALGRRAQRPDWTIEALEAMVAKVARALAADGKRAATEVPARARNVETAVDLLLAIAELEKREGRSVLALAALKRALTLAADHPVATHLALELALASGKHDQVEALVKRELGQSSVPLDVADLQLALAESTMARNDSARALDSLRAALAADSSCWLAWALELELTRGTGGGADYARTLARMSGTFRQPEARRHHSLLAAALLARDGRDAEAARRALEAAEHDGSPRVMVRRLARALAHVARDRTWYAAAVRDLLETDSAGNDRAGLLIEAWRMARLARAPLEADRHLEALDALAEGRLFARLARAYCSGDATEAALAMIELEELETEPTRAAAIAWVSALRAALSGQRQAGMTRLLDAHARHPKSALIAGTLAHWLLDRDAGAPASAAKVLRTTASAHPDDALAASLYIEAGIRCWRAGARTDALADFESAQRRGAGCAWALDSWCRQAMGMGPALAEPLPATEPRGRLLTALERALRTKTPVPELLTSLHNALRACSDSERDDLTHAARLSTLLLGRSLGLRAEPQALTRFAAQGADAARLADVLRYVDCLSQPSVSARAFEDASRRWSESSGSLAATLEWTAAAARTAERQRECAARRRLAEHLDDTLREHCAASAALVAHISQAEPAPFLSGKTPALRLTNLETSPPGVDLRRRARALDEAAPLLGEDEEPIARLLQGYNLLALGDRGGASACFKQYAEAFPDDPAGFEGMLAAASPEDDPVFVAEATASLGNTSRDPAHAARLFEEAADIFFERVNDPVAGQAALARAVDLDIHRGSSFSRLFALTRETGDAARLLELATRRLAVASDSEEIAELEWERARAARKLDDTELALTALDALVALKPEHLGALALHAEIYITQRRYAEAAEKLAELAARADAPHEQRLTSGLYAVDLFENQLDATQRAMQVLLTLHRASLGTLAVRERLARAAAKSGAWDEAAVVLEQLMYERSTLEERAEAARLALAIHRDRRQDPRAAGHAAEVLLSLSPRDADALDLALGGALDPLLTEKLLEIGRGALEQHLEREPCDVDALRRLAQSAEQLGDPLLRQTTLGVLSALGQGEPERRAELTALDQRISTTPALTLPSDLLEALADPEDRGPIPQLLSTVQPYLSPALGPTLATFQVRKRDRIAASAGMPIRNEISAWVGGFDLGRFELYLSPLAAERIAVLATDPIAIIIGPGVSAPMGPFQRQELVRSLYALRRGVLVLTHLDTAEVLALIAALSQLAGAEPVAAHKYARQDDFARQLARGLPRKLLKLLPELTRPIVAQGQPPEHWLRAGISSLDRAAALAVGDVSTILDELGQTRGSRPGVPSDRARRLIGFVLSRTYPALRRQLGVSVR